MLDDDDPLPTWKDRLLHPLPIAAILLVVVGGGLWGWDAWEDARRAREQQAVEPLEREWEALWARAPGRLAQVEAVLAGAPAAVEQRCEGLTGTVEVVHRPVLQGLAAGDRAPRPDAPGWLSSQAYRYLAHMSTPSLSEPAYRARHEVVAAALARPCVAVLETELAEHARARGNHELEGGGVVGWLRVVCVDEPRIACQARVASQPLLAVVVEQRDPRAQAGANATAASDAAMREHWEAVQAVLAQVGPGLTVVHD